MKVENDLLEELKTVACECLQQIGPSPECLKSNEKIQSEKLATCQCSSATLSKHVDTAAQKCSGGNLRFEKFVIINPSINYLRAQKWAENYYRTLAKTDCTSALNYWDICGAASSNGTDVNADSVDMSLTGNETDAAGQTQMTGAETSTQSNSNITDMIDTGVSSQFNQSDEPPQNITEAPIESTSDQFGGNDTLTTDMALINETSTEPQLDEASFANDTLPTSPGPQLETSSHNHTDIDEVGESDQFIHNVTSIHSQNATILPLVNITLDANVTAPTGD